MGNNHQFDHKHRNNQSNEHQPTYKKHNTDAKCQQKQRHSHPLIQPELPCEEAVADKNIIGSWNYHPHTHKQTAKSCIVKKGAMQLSKLPNQMQVPAVYAN